MDDRIVIKCNDGDGGSAISFICIRLSRDECSERQENVENPNS